MIININEIEEKINIFYGMTLMHGTKKDIEDFNIIIDWINFLEKNIGIKRCPVCNKKFTAKRKNQKYCSKKCNTKINAKKYWNRLTLAERRTKRQTKEYKAEYRKNHKDKIKEYMAEYRKNHKDKIKEYNARYREKQKHKEV